MNREAFISQVSTALMSQLDALERFLGLPESGPTSGLRRRVLDRARELADQIDDPNTRADAARTVMAALYGHKPEPPEFWRSEVGVQVAHAIGYHRPTVTFPTAAVILGVSRQRVYQLTRIQGQLRVVEGQMAVTRASLLDVLRNQARRAA